MNQLEKQIRDAYVRIRTIDHTIPDEVLDFMKDAAIEKARGEVYTEQQIRDAAQYTAIGQGLLDDLFKVLKDK